MATARRLPEWLKVKAPGSAGYLELRQIVRSEGLNTVCEEAHCPNIGECWDRGTATFMVLGDTCTRACSYCAVKTGMPTTLDLQEPARLGETVERLGLRYAVITSVDRDDLPDGGAFIFAQCIPADSQAAAFVQGGGAYSGLPGRCGRAGKGDGSETGYAEPQHRDGAASIQQGET